MVVNVIGKQVRFQVDTNDFGEMGLTDCMVVGAMLKIPTYAF